MDQRATAGLPQTLDEAFDLTTDEIEQWELDQIQVALRMDAIQIDRHAQRAALDDGFDIDEIYTVILRGEPIDKDTSTDADRKREPGINFEGEISGGRTIQLKVTYDRGWYRIATTYVIGRTNKK